MPYATAISIMLAAVLANHLGLIAAIEGVISKVMRHNVRLPIINCSKCLTFWVTLAFVAAKHQRALLDPWEAVMLPPVMSYMAVWTELLFGWLDTLYSKVYDTLYPDGSADDSLSATAEHDTDPHTDVPQRPLDAVPDVW